MIECGDAPCSPHTSLLWAMQVGFLLGMVTIVVLLSLMKSGGGRPSKGRACVEQDAAETTAAVKEKEKKLPTVPLHPIKKLSLPETVNASNQSPNVQAPGSVERMLLRRPLSPVAPVIQERKPSKPMQNPPPGIKRLHWTRTIMSSKERDDDRVVWNHLPAVHIDKPLMDGFFIRPKKTTTKAKKNVTNPKHPSSVLDGNRVRRFCIMLSRIPNQRVLHQALLDADQDVLTLEVLSLLCEAVPTAEEQRTVASLSAHTRLPAPESFVALTCKVRYYEDRIRALRFICCFDETVDALYASVCRLSRCFEEIHQSPSLQHLLAIILEMGNYMNGGTQQGRADAFAIDVLPMLTGTKTFKHCIPFFSFVRFFFEHESKLAAQDIVQLECPSLCSARLGMHLGEMKEEMADIESGFTQCQDLHARLEQDEPLFGVLRSFNAKAADRIVQLDKAMKKALHMYSTLVHYLGSTTHQPIETSNDLLSLLFSFMNNVARSSSIPQTDLPSSSRDVPSH